MYERKYFNDNDDTHKTCHSPLYTSKKNEVYLHSFYQLKSCSSKKCETSKRKKKITKWWNQIFAQKIHLLTAIVVTNKKKCLNFLFYFFLSLLEKLPHYTNNSFLKHTVEFLPALWKVAYDESLMTCEKNCRNSLIV